MLRRLALAVSCLFLAGSTYATGDQNESALLVSKFNDLTNQWALISYDLRTYDGLKKYCADHSFRRNVAETLNGIHHYDSLLYERLTVKARFSNNHEIKKVIHQIEAFETKYKASNFSKTLSEECSDQRSLEKNSDELRNDIGMNSYDSQVILLEATLDKYVKNITKLMDHINDHIHHLHID
jgi:hypothetical protein